MLRGTAGDFLETDGIVPPVASPSVGVLPDPTGHAGEFLTTPDGITVGWSAVSVLPDQSGHTGEFLTTDGSVLSWAPGGGGGGVTTVGALTTATANAAVITGATLQLAPADATNPGAMTATGQTLGGLKLFPAGAATNIHDIRDFGAIQSWVQRPATSSNDAIDAAIAACKSYTNPPFQGGQVYIPEGNWTIDRPILLPGTTPTNIIFFGEGTNHSILIMADGTSTYNPTGPQQFAGPMILCGAYGAASLSRPSWLTPKYDSPLLGATGRSLRLEMPFAFWLHDSWAWLVPMFEGPAIHVGKPVCVQCEVRIDNLGTNPPWAGWQWPDPGLGPPQDECSIIGSRGPGGANGPTIGWGFYAKYVDSSNFKFRCYLTTLDNGLQYIESGQYANGGTHNLEFNYDGTNEFWFYVDGVLIGSPVAASGWVDRSPQEGISIGRGGPEWQGTTSVYAPNGAIDSIRLSNATRHASSVGSFTPPTAKYTWDANTMALCNWDQPDPPGPDNQPFIMAQCASGNGGVIRHFIRFVNLDYSATEMPTFGGSVLRDFQLSCGLAGSGIIAYQSAIDVFERIEIYGTTYAGFSSWDPGSYFSDSKEVWCFSGYGYGILQYARNAIGNITFGHRIGQHYLTGNIQSCGLQPGTGMDGPPYYHEAASEYCYVFGGSIESFFSGVIVKGCGIDAEGVFPTIKAGVLVYGNSLGTFTSEANTWATQGCSFNGVPSYAVEFDGIPQNGATFTNDVLSTEPGALGYFTKGGRSLNGKIRVIQPRTNGWNPPVPISDTDGWVSVETVTAKNNQTGISISDVQANNLAGTFLAIGGYTVANVSFYTAEPDANYIVICNCMGAIGGTPAAGSTSVVQVDTRSDGFLVTLGADPGGSVILTFSYVLVRMQPPSLFSEDVVTIPSTIANPLVPVSPTGDWAVGISTVPADGKCIMSSLDDKQTIIEAGTAPTNWWTIFLHSGNRWGWEYGGANLFNFVDAFSYNGKLYGFLQPGPHNVVIGYQNGRAWASMDGGFPPNYPTPAHPLSGTQQTPIYIGDNSGGTQTLTVATLRHLKIDTVASRVATSEPDYGPLTRPQSAIFGDSMTCGQDCGSPGSWATQIQANRFATKYYWNASRSVWSDGCNLTVPAYWTNWGAIQPAALEAIAIQLGTTDILNIGRTAVATWNDILGILEGTQAQAAFIPPTGNAVANAKFQPPLSGTATCVINGVSFLCTWAGDVNTTVNNLVALILLDAGVTALVTPSNAQGVLLITAVASGTAGNGIPISTNGANGAYWYFLRTTTVGGGYASCVIEGVSFDVIFNTDADTTINDLITLIGLDAPTMALVTPTLDSVNHVMVLTAVSRGIAGNAITLATNNLLNSRFGLNQYGFPQTHSMAGAVAGAVDKAIPIILVCNLPPMGDSTNYTGGKEIERLAFNVLAANWCTAHAADGAVLVDTDTALWLSSDHTKIDPTYLAGVQTDLNGAGQTVLYGLLDPLLP